ncbi:MAG: DUF4388 domain-containing protein [Candidatus Limnocylindria bacterium]
MSLRGTLEHFPLETIVQLLASTSKTGQLEVRPDSADGLGGALGFADGRLVSASSGSDSGEDALGVVFSAERGEFEFIPWREAPSENLKGDLNSLLDRALQERDRMTAVREVVPRDTMRFRLSDRAAQKDNITLNSTQWRALLAVNGERDVTGIAETLGSGRMPTLQLLAELLRAGMIDGIDPGPQAPAPAASAGAAESTGGERRVSRPSEPASGGTSAASPAADGWSAPLDPGSDAPADARWSRPADTTTDPQPDAPPTDPRTDAPQAVDERLAAITGAVGTPGTASPPPAWQPAPTQDAARPTDGHRQDGRTPAALNSSRWSVPPPEPEKRRGLFGFLKREEIPVDEARPGAAAPGRNGQLASFANALLAEYNTGQYGKPGIDDRIANLLMRVDEQADPIDRPLPIVDDRIDVATLEREAPPEDQLAPYLAVLVNQIYEDAETAFGRDKAKRGYRAAQQQVFGGDNSTLSAPDLASRLPKA